MSGGVITETAQYLTFTLDEEMYALEISKVREVLEYSSVTKVPRTPDYMRGVINLRGNVVPVADLKLKFGLKRTEKTVDTCVVIVEVAFNGTNVVLGMLTDSVQEVIDLEPSRIEPPPNIGTRLDTAFIRGMGKRNEEFIIILDIDKVFSTEDIAMVGHTETAPGMPKVNEGARTSEAQQGV